MKKQELYVEKAVEWFDFWASEYIKNVNYHGFSISVAKGNDIIYSNAFGINTKDESLKDSHLFRMASHSKNMTAIAIMQLVEQNKLALDDKIVKHLDFLNSEDKVYQNITVRQVLNHSAGIKRDGFDATFWSNRRAFPDKLELKEFFKNSKAYVENNTRLKYSNLGYGLLGLLIEKITGQEYNQYIQDNLFVGLDYIAMDSDLVDKSKTAKGYLWKSLTGKFEVIETIQSTGSLSAATGLVATTKSMCEFYTKLYYGNESLISDESKKELFKANFDMSEDAKVKYGLGFRNKDYKGFTQIGHTGGFPGHMTATACEPKEKIVISCASNDIYGAPLSIVNTFIDFLKLFEKNKKDLVEQDEYNFKKVMVSLWGIALYLPIGNKVYALSAECPIPTNNCNELEKDGSDTKYKITKSETTGFYGEEVEFFFDEEKILKSLNWAGCTMARKEGFKLP